MADKLYMTDFPGAAAWQEWAFQCMQEDDPIYSADMILRSSGQKKPKGLRFKQPNLSNSELLEVRVDFCLLAADFCADVMHDYEAAAGIVSRIGLEEIAEEYKMMRMDAKQTVTLLPETVVKTGQAKVKPAIPIPAYNIPRKHGLDVCEQVRRDYEMHRIYAQFVRECE